MAGRESASAGSPTCGVVRCLALVDIRARVCSDVRVGHRAGSPSAARGQVRLALRHGVLLAHDRRMHARRCMRCVLQHASRVSNDCPAIREGCTWDFSVRCDPRQLSHGSIAGA